MEAKALAPEPISSYSVLLSPCLPSLFAAHLRQIHPFVCQAVCFESFSACYWFSSPRLFLVLFFFLSASNIDLIFPHLFFSLRSLIISRLHHTVIAYLGTFLSFISFYLLALSISRLCFFLMESAVGGGLQCVDSALCLSACVCLGKDMLLTLWLSFIW